MTQTPHIDPPEFTASAASQWKLRDAGARPSLATDLRDALGIAPLRPVIMTGHQAGFWHCGILAKTLAASACAARAPSTSLLMPSVLLPNRRPHATTLNRRASARISAWA